MKSLLVLVFIYTLGATFLGIRVDPLWYLGAFLGLIALLIGVDILVQDIYKKR